MLAYFVLLVALLFAPRGGLLQKNTTSFNKVYFKKSPLGMGEGKIKDFIKDAYFAPVNGGQLFEALYIVNRGNTIHPDNFRVYYRMDGTEFLTRSAYEQDSLNNYLFQIKFTNNQEDKISPLEIIYQPNTEYVLVRWLDSGALPKIIEEYPYKTGKRLPNLILKNDTTELRLTDLSGDIIVINWWSTTCAPCIQEIPGFNKLFAKYKNVKFISIIYDSKNLFDFLKKHEYKFPHFFGNEQIVQVFGKRFPRNIVLDREGTIVYNKTGGSAATAKKIEEILSSLNAD